MKTIDIENPTLELVWIKPGDAMLNPLNWRRHPEEQLAALDDLIFGEGGIGWAGAALINHRREADGWAPEDARPTFVDGHARETLAQEHDAEIPALIGHWTPQQEALILATLDPLSEMVQGDQVRLTRLLERAPADTDALTKLMARVATEHGLYKVWMQGLGSPTEGDLEEVVAAREDDGEDEDEDIFALGDDEWGEEDDDGLLDPEGKHSVVRAIPIATFADWKLPMTDEEADALDDAIRAYADEKGMLNFFASEVLLSDIQHMPTIDEDDDEEE